MVGICQGTEVVTRTWKVTEILLKSSTFSTICISNYYISLLFPSIMEDLIWSYHSSHASIYHSYHKQNKSQYVTDVRVYCAERFWQFSCHESSIYHWSIGQRVVHTWPYFILRTKPLITYMLKIKQVRCLMRFSNLYKFTNQILGPLVLLGFQHSLISDLEDSTFSHHVILLLLHTLSPLSTWGERKECMETDF